ncbi:hypothetical protein [Flavobacterium rhizosphaerae]|uniref:Uncharacterized protein n=1 Tax=Flavobacterium rhizosphaerae TaxID=3163298 RepID=A0ABW8Z1S4_9FLAO
MEQNKLEKQIKQKLEQRTIQPGPAAWDRLDAMLSVTEKKKTPNRAWLYMAACFIALLVGGGIFLNQQEGQQNVIDNNTNVVIHQEQQPEPLEGKPEVFSSESTHDIVEDITPETQIHKNTAVAQVRVSKQNKGLNTATQQKEQLQPLVVTPTVIDETPFTKAVAQQEVNKNKIEVNASSLLASVETDIALEQVLTTGNSKISGNKTRVAINSNSLLTSVEGELDESFRSKALQTVVKNFNAVKTSVANRNHK